MDSWRTEKPLTDQNPMPQKRESHLEIEPVKEGDKIVTYRLYGYVWKKTKRETWEYAKIRNWDQNLSVLEQLKEKLLKEAEHYEKQLSESANVLQTWLTPDRLRDAEAACRKLPPGRTLLECVEAADRVLGTGEPIACDIALTRWEENMKMRKLETTTVKDNQGRVRRFMEGVKPTPNMLHDITPKIAERYIRRSGAAPITQLGDARVLHAWFNFCIGEKWLRVNPVQLDISEMRDRAKSVSEPEILTPEESQRLLDAAAASGDVPIVFFIIVSLWLFLRRSEALRLTEDDVIARYAGKKLTEVKIHLRGKKLGSRWRDLTVPIGLAPLLMETVERKALQGPRNEKGQLMLNEWTWKHVRAKAGLIKVSYAPDRPNRPIIEESDWAANILRHTGMSYLYQETGDAKLVTDRAGNSEQVAFMHYLRRAEPDAYKKFNAATSAFPIAHTAQAVS